METYQEWRTARGCGQPFNPAADIAKRWQKRIVAQGLSGRMGASVYMGRYGKNIGADKLVKLARTAEQHLCDWAESDEMAQFFWEAAYQLATGEPVPVGERRSVGNSPKADSEASGVNASSVKPHARDLPGIAAQAEDWTVFPAHLRPGALVTMQPTDAQHPREWYIAHPAYCGQPKRDGQRMVIFATAEAIAYQGRSLALQGVPDPDMDAILRLTAQEIGPFILDGELWWPDAEGGEHRTAPQALRASQELGRGEERISPKFAVFEALFYRRDLTAGMLESRLNAAKTIVENLRGGWLLFEFLAPVYLASDKRRLAEAQHAEGREGEVWRLLSAPYTGGKLNARGSLEPIVRTKYLIERVVRVTGLTASGATKVARRFAAIEVCDPETGKPLGKVGTGFTQADQATIEAGFTAAQAAGVPFLIEVAAASVSEYGVLYQPRFEKIVT